LSSDVREETYEPTPEEEEIERRQEAQRIALLHGGFTDMIDFEEAIKKHGPDFHGAHGYGASLGDALKKGQKVDPDEDPIHKAIRIQREKKEQAAKEALKHSMPKTDGTEQVAFDVLTAADTNHSATGTKVTHASPPTDSPDPYGGSEGVTSPAAPLPSVAEGGPERTAPAAAEHIKDEL